MELGSQHVDVDSREGGNWGKVYLLVLKGAMRAMYKHSI